VEHVNLDKVVVVEGVEHYEGVCLLRNLFICHLDLHLLPSSACVLGKHQNDVSVVRVLVLLEDTYLADVHLDLSSWHLCELVVDHS